MDYLPELTHNGQNWITYASSVLCAISDKGLMGFLVGSEKRPIHPAELDGRGEGWTPQTNEERDEVTAWRATDQSWTQQNAMVNYTIVSGIPDTIFGCMLHLKSPLKKWDYLEKRFGSIPRPESWLAAEEGMQQSRSQPEQNVAGETAQSTCNSHNETPKPPNEAEGFLDSPNDCAKTESRYLTPETEVIDAQGVENNLNDCTEIPTGYLEPEMDIVDVQRAEGCSLVVETGITDTKWLVKAPDERSQRTDDSAAKHRNIPEWISEASEPADDAARYTHGCSIENVSTECNEHIPTNGETIADVPDPPGVHAEPPTPHARCSTLQNKPPAQVHSRMITEPRLPCT
ncbi:hypothetical protein EDC04DRAFT_2914675 [Pisolithus marmoratus]|nr:hypothetical protein EDC04DRAFT_2914675 [Pisolithus marmoratus]